jgi:hypothetical protein
MDVSGGAAWQPTTVLPFDWPWDEGETIRACPECSSWCAEIVAKAPDDAIWVREWHAIECAIWTELRGQGE